MNIFSGAYQYVLENSERFLEALLTHLEISVCALFIASVLCIPLGIWCAMNNIVTGPVMAIFSSLRVIPSLAILIIVMPILGTGFVPALFALTILACPPILINTYLGFKGIEPGIVEAATGMGMDGKTMLRVIKIPLAVPLIVAGIKTASVEVIASATLAAFIGGGGLGIFIINGLGLYNFSLLLVGALPVALLAILFETGFSGLERLVTKFQRD